MTSKGTSDIEFSKALKLISCFAIGLGLIVLWGWAFDIDVLKSIIPGYISMKINAAVSFILIGMVLLHLVLGKWNVTSKVATIGIILISIDCMLKMDYWIPTFLKTVVENTDLEFRSSIPAAICFLFIGIVYLFIKSEILFLKKTALLLLHLVTIISLFSFLTSFTDINNFGVIEYDFLPAVHTTATLFCLSIGIPFLEKDIGIVKLFTGNQLGNVLSRILFPKIFAAVFTIAIIGQIVLEYRLIPQNMIIAITIILFLMIVLYLVRSKVNKINAVDDLRIKAEKNLVTANINLEKKVEIRTNYLVKQKEALENITYIFSHNLRSPVSTILPLLQFYKKEKDIEKKDLYIDKIEITVNKLNDTLEELLEVVSLRNVLKSETLFLESIYLTTLEVFQVQITDAGAQVTYDFSKAPELNYPSIYLESILQNLLSNALKYKSPDRTPVIHFETKKHNNKIKLRVSDNGLGIDLEQNRNVLFGFHKTFHKHPEARGLGLFLIKTQIENMGGSITATSQVNKGTTFEIIF